MLEQREAVADDPVAWMSPGKETLEFSRPDTVYGSHTIPLYASRHARQVPDGLDESSCVPVTRPNIYAAGWNDYRGCMLRSEERRVGKECVSTLRCWWSSFH